MNASNYTLLSALGLGNQPLGGVSVCPCCGQPLFLLSQGALAPAAQSQWAFTTIPAGTYWDRAGARHHLVRIRRHDEYIPIYPQLGM